MDAARLIGHVVEPADVRQDILIAVLFGELAEPAGAIVDAELEIVTRPRLNEA
jgi:hypothetical protein